jgi:ubiquinol-cytochrome c reductase core subunit 2
LEYDAFQTSPVSLALDSLHTSAFHRGLGTSILISPTTPIHADQVEAYAKKVYTKANLVIVASGTSADHLKPQIAEFWKNLPSGEALKAAPTKYSGGENRIPHNSSQNIFAIGFPGASLYAGPEYIVLSHLLGGPSNIKWSVGHSALAKLAAGISSNVSTLATSLSYSDAGLFTVLIAGSPSDVSKTAAATVKLLRDIAKGSHAIKPEEVKRAVASARYTTFAAAEARLSGLEPIGQSVLDNGKPIDLNTFVSHIAKVTPEKLKEVLHFFTTLL